MGNVEGFPPHCGYMRHSEVGFPGGYVACLPVGHVYVCGVCVFCIKVNKSESRSGKPSWKQAQEILLGHCGGHLTGVYIIVSS